MSTVGKDPRDILIAPVVSEKSYGLLDEGKYTFLVDPRANKTEIKKAIESLFKVKVVKINTVTLPGKVRRFGASQSQQADRKKAVATLKEGDKINLFEGA